jgi:hypothetical protein
MGNDLKKGNREDKDGISRRMGKNTQNDRGHLKRRRLNKVKNWQRFQLLGIQSR